MSFFKKLQEKANELVKAADAELKNTLGEEKAEQFKRAASNLKDKLETGAANVIQTAQEIGKEVITNLEQQNKTAEEKPVEETAKKKTTRKKDGPAQ